MVIARIIAIIVPLLAGALLGAILGSILTGSDGYVIAWSVGGPIAIMAIIFLSIARNGSKRKAVPPQASQPVGINETVVAGSTATSAVLNPSSSAVPSSGVLLNGEPMEGVHIERMPQPDARPVRLRRAFWFVLLAAGAALALIPAYTMIGWIASDFVHGRPFDGRDMRTGLHQNDAMNQIADVVGSHDITRVNFYEDYVIVTARTSPRSTTVDTYMWRYGSAYREGPGGFEPDLAAELFDASKVDFSIIPELITIAKRDAGMNDADDYYPSVARDTGGDVPGDPVISISLSNDYFDAYYTFSLDGEILDKSGSAFE
jgi:hypothetical protein